MAETSAVIRTGGKQYLVAAGQTINVEKLPAEAGSEVSFDEVLLVRRGDEVNVGTPLVAGAKVTGRVEKQGKLTKVTGYKFKNKTRYTRHLGHRQLYTAVKIEKVG